MNLEKIKIKYDSKYLEDMFKNPLIPTKILLTSRDFLLNRNNFINNFGLNRKEIEIELSTYRPK
jgi:hypothetical protein